MTPTSQQTKRTLRNRVIDFPVLMITPPRSTNHWGFCPLVSGMLFPFQEIYYYTNCGNEVANQQITSEGMSVRVKEDGNQELAETLTSEGAPLQNGLIPEAEAATEAGQKALCEAIVNAAVATPKAKAIPKDKTERAEPKTILEWGGLAGTRYLGHH